MFVDRLFWSGFGFFWFHWTEEFRTRTTCEGDELKLQCDSRQRLAVYSAKFGRSQNQEDNEKCPQTLYFDAGK